MSFREITAADLPALAALLSEGFPSTTTASWTKALDVMSQRPPVEGMPRYGIGLEVGGVLCGVMLMISQRRSGMTFCNLSSWYVREANRGMAPFLFGHALKTKEVTYLDCSPTPDVVPIVEKYGFTPYSGGSVLLDPGALLRGRGKVERLTPATLAACGDPEEARIAENLSWGCTGLLARDAEGGPAPLVYRVVRVKRGIPVARFLYGAPETILSHAGAILRHLSARGIPFALVDYPQGETPPVGRVLPDYGVRYMRGAHRPPVGDLLDTEYALFGI